MVKPRKALILAFACALLVAGATPAARADALYNLTFDSCTGGCGPQTAFGAVNLHSVNATTMQITVSLLNGNKFLTTGAHTGFAFNVKGGVITLGTLPTHWSDAGSPVTEPALGVFSNGIDCASGNTNNKRGCAGSNPWSGVLQFNVSRTGGLTYSDFVANGGGFFFAADILSGTTGRTGLVGSQGSVVPEPASLLLLGSGLVGVTWTIRRRLRL